MSINNDEKILTLHPSSKQGVNILKRRYDMIKDFILDTLNDNEMIGFSELCDLADLQIKDRFDGSIMWYMVTVKLDLEARGMIERVPKKKLQTIRLSK